MSNRTCRQFEERLNDLMDRRLALQSDKQLQHHAGECCLCNALLRDYSRLNSLISDNHPSDSGLLFQTGNKTNKQTGISPAANDPRTVPLQNGWIGTVAALLLVAVSAGFFFASESTTPVQTARNDNPAVVDDVPTQSVSAVVPAGITADAGSTQSQVDDGIPGNIPIQTDISGFVTFKWPAALQPLDAYYSELPGVRPLQGSFNATVDYLERTFGSKPEPPAPESEEKPDGSSGTSSLFRGIVVAV